MRNTAFKSAAKKTLLNHLLKKYAIILVSLILIGMVSIGLNSYWQSMDRGRMTVQESLDTINRSMNEKNLQGRIMLNNIVDSPEKINNINQYMELPISEYLMFTYDHQLQTGNYFYLPGQVANFYRMYESIKSVAIVLNNHEGYYLSTSENKAGKKMNGALQLTNKFYLAYPIANPDTSEILGSFYVEFSDQEIKNSLAHLTSFNGLSAYVFSNTGYQLLDYMENPSLRSSNEQIEKSVKDHSSLPIVELEKDHLLEHEQLSNGMEIIVMILKKEILKSAVFDLRFLILGGLLLISLLLYLLYYTFTQYSQQVAIIMDSMSLVSKGAVGTRIKEEETQFELRELSHGINTMLDNIEQYIADLYKLEIKQQDAHMRALQSQISPHFLYNTLEYIRMYALSEGSEELADVVYAFSTLLRNNTDQEKTTTLEKELDFCEKYVYLFQMRYPDQIAYSFEIDPRLNDLVLPKFSIQPLIENYFVHGIDFVRSDNAISVKAQLIHDRVVILIRDNGKGMSEAKLNLVQEKLAVNQIILHDSIGLQNVNERLRAYFGSTFSMIISQNEVKGISLVLSFKKEDTDEL